VTASHSNKNVARLFTETEMSILKMPSVHFVDHGTAVICRETWHRARQSDAP
jgi:hypothetical protein